MIRAVWLSEDYIHPQHNSECVILFSLYYQKKERPSIELAVCCVFGILIRCPNLLSWHPFYSELLVISLRLSPATLRRVGHYPQLMGEGWMAIIQHQNLGPEGEIRLRRSSVDRVCEASRF